MTATIPMSTLMLTETEAESLAEILRERVTVLTVMLGLSQITEAETALFTMRRTTAEAMLRRLDATQAK